MIRNHSPLRRGLRSLVAVLSTLALGSTGCAINTPVRVVPSQPGDQPEDRLQVSLTHAVIDPEQGGTFHEYTRRVLDSLPDQPGLVSHSVRRELLGNEVWTMTVGESDTARSKFFGSGAHVQAMAHASRAILNVRTQRLEVPRSALPLTWPQVLAWLGPPSWQMPATREVQR